VLINRLSRLWQKPRQPDRARLLSGGRRRIRLASIDEKKIAANKVILYGGSLGGGIATDLASRKEHRALVLDQTFPRPWPDVASDLYWWLPAPKHMLKAPLRQPEQRSGRFRRPVFHRARPRPTD